MKILDKLVIIAMISVSFMVCQLQNYYLEKRINHIESITFGSSRCLK